jgi:hypothetical protein
MDRKLVGLVLLVAGILAVAYGGFTYTRTTHEAEIGALEVEVHDRERVNIPLWFGLAVAIGGGLLVIGSPQKS